MIDNNDKAYIFASAIELSYKRCADIFNHYSTPYDFLIGIYNEDKFLKEILGSDFENAKNKLNNFSFETFEKYLKTKNVGYVTKNSKEYPQNLYKLDQPPFILYYIGDLSLTKTDCFAMVGTRSPSYYGREITLQFAKELSEAGFVIVSGLSVGVDKISHETALKTNGKTIAVLGNGFERMYPAENINLAKEIAQKGLLLTEYYPTYPARNYSFPARNRIIAALCQGVLITEAAKKSGSLYTKDYALDMGIDVFAVPGNVTSVKSEGTNNIIKCGHAGCVTTPSDILKLYGKKTKKTKKEKIQLNFDEQKIYNYLINSERSFDELQMFTGFSAQILNTYLTTLQIRGIIKKLPGNLYSV